MSVKNEKAGMKIMLAVCVAVLILAVAAAALPTAEETEIYTRVLRLHVVANSDTDADQTLKLLVRDAILSDLAEILGGCTDREEAEAAVAANLGSIVETARQTVSDAGYDYPVAAEVVSEHYPDRVYEEITLPAGTYRSLRVVIGSGDGHNWWCVLFPQLCTAAATERETVVEAGFTTNQVRILTETGKTGYKVKFKLLEIISAFLNG